MKFIKSFVLVAVLTASALTFACEKHQQQEEDSKTQHKPEENK